jgi:hypothetical protein
MDETLSGMERVTESAGVVSESRGARQGKKRRERKAPQADAGTPESQETVREKPKEGEPGYRIDLIA